MSYVELNKLELFIANTQRIRKEFLLKNESVKRMAALLYAQEGRELDCETIRQCHTLIKENTGVFSSFRGNMSLCMETLLALSPAPQERLNETLKVYDRLKEARFHASDFLAVTACQIASHAHASEYDKVIERTKSFYEGMKAHHFFYTGQDDYVFAAMLGLSDVDVTSGIEQMEQLYSRLKNEFSDHNSVQTLAQVLVLGGSDERIVTRILALRDAMRAEKIRLDKTYTLPVLGILALLPVEIETMVRKTISMRDTLKAQKGFGSLSISSQELLLFAASMIADDYTGELGDGMLAATLSNSITNIILAQQMVMIAMISASSAAASAASS